MKLSFYPFFQLVLPKGISHGATKLIAVLSFGFLVLYANNAYATSCGKILTFDEQISKADVVFEGHFVRYEMKKVNFKTEEHHFNFNKPGIYVLTTTFAVDKAWKGIHAGQEATKVYAWPIYPEFKDMFLERTRSENKYKTSKIFAFDKAKENSSDDTSFKLENPKIYDDFYYDTICGGEYDIKPNLILKLQQKFPAAAQ